MPNRWQLLAPSPPMKHLSSAFPVSLSPLPHKNQQRSNMMQMFPQPFSSTSQTATISTTASIKLHIPCAVMPCSLRKQAHGKFKFIMFMMKVHVAVCSCKTTGENISHHGLFVSCCGVFQSYRHDFHQQIFFLTTYKSAEVAGRSLKCKNWTPAIPPWADSIWWWLSEMIKSSITSAK